MDALVTGGTGFVGANLARELLAAGATVRVLARPGGDRRALDGLKVEIVEGDLLDATSLARACSGVGTVYHVAADYRLWAPDPGEILRTNVDGTRAVMAAALKAGVERIVYTSSVATLKLGDEGRVAGETSPLSEHEAIGAYKRSKVAAERLVEGMVKSSGLPAVIVNPSTPIGPRDVRPTPTGRIIVEAASGRMPAFVDTGLNLVHVDDVAAGHVAALERGRIGERYILGGENLSLAQLLSRIASLTGRRPPSIRLPRELIYPLALGAEAIARFTRREPFVTVDGLRMAKYKMFFTSAKAQRELGYTSRPIDEALRDALAWFRARGYVP